MSTHSDDTHRSASHCDYYEDENYRRGSGRHPKDTISSEHELCNRDQSGFRNSSFWHDRDNWNWDSRSRPPCQSHSRSPNPKHDHSTSFCPATSKSPSTQLSLFDSINDFISSSKFLRQLPLLKLWHAGPHREFLACASNFRTS